MNGKEGVLGVLVVLDEERDGRPVDGLAGQPGHALEGQDLVGRVGDVALLCATVRNSVVRCGRESCVP